MTGVGLGVVFLGYWVMTYGWSQLRGCNAGFFAIVWPGSSAYTGCEPDAAAGSTPAPIPQNVTPGGGDSQCPPGYTYDTSTKKCVANTKPGSPGSKGLV